MHSAVASRRGTVRVGRRKGERARRSRTLDRVALRTAMAKAWLSVHDRGESLKGRRLSYLVSQGKAWLSYLRLGTPYMLRSKKGLKDRLSGVTAEGKARLLARWGPVG